MGKVMTLVGTQGTGKSTLAINLAWALDDLLKGCFDGRIGGCPVLLMDATPESTISQFCKKRTSAKVEKMVHDDLEAGYIYTTRNPRATSRHIKKVRDAYETVIVDTSSANPSQVDELMKATDSLLLVTTPCEEETDWLKFLRSAYQRNPRMTLQQMVFNRFRDDSTIDRAAMESADTILSALDDQYTDHFSILPQSDEFARSYDRKDVAYLDDTPIEGYSRSAGDIYYQLAEQIVGGKRQLPIATLLNAIEEKTEERELLMKTLS